MDRSKKGENEKMALKQLMLTRERKEKEELLAKIEKEMEELRGSREAWKLRESNAVKALEELEAKPDASEEERKAFDDEAAEIEKEDAELTEKENDAEQRANEAKKRIGEIDTELEELKKRFEEGSKKEPENKKTENTNERGVIVSMNVREQIREMVKREDVKQMLDQVRDRIRGVNGAELTVPVVMLPTVSANIEKYSKLLKHVNKVSVKGEGRQNILGAIPEAVWTEAIGKINELDIGVSQIQTDGNKVAGYIPVPNAYLEDSDESLAALVMDYLGQSIGYALDKAILYGDGVKKPVGIATRLAATTSPAWWQSKMPAFKDISGTNIGKLSSASVKDAAAYREMMAVLGKAKAVYNAGAGGRFWAMSNATWLKLQAMLMTFNASGAVTTGAAMQMPIIGGTVELLDMVNDGDILGGYGSNYVLTERRGTTINRSEHAMFIEDMTVFKGTARYDGMPMAGEAFALFNIDGAAPKTSETFAEDKANA
jgi:HK97 family phage major capsid protein